MPEEWIETAKILAIAVTAMLFLNYIADRMSRTVRALEKLEESADEIKRGLVRVERLLASIHDAQP